MCHYCHRPQHSHLLYQSLPLERLALRFHIYPHCQSSCIDQCNYGQPLCIGNDLCGSIIQLLFMEQSFIVPSAANNDLDTTENSTDQLVL